MKLLEHIATQEDHRRKWIAVGLTNVIAGLLTIWGIYGINEYGVALFIITPLFIGFGSTFLYGYKNPTTLSRIWPIGLLTLVIFTAILILCAIEGFICIAMAAPIGLGLTFIGSLIGYAMITSGSRRAPTTFVIMIGLIPLTAFVERNSEPVMSSVVTNIEIDAVPGLVWKNVVKFPRLDEPTEFLFKTGIAYPIDATIEGTGPGAIRRCNFSTGSFIEPITIWDEPNLLKFDVTEQPVPLKELSFWDIDAPHLHDYFVSTQGQFRLIALPNGRTRLEGTTWYYHDIRPTMYWRLWSDRIIHKIHLRVLKHIKVSSELSIHNGDDSGNNTFPQWSHDGEHIAFTSDRDGDPEIYIMKADGTEQVRLTHSPGRDAHPSFSRDGKTILFQSPRENGEDTNIYRMDADGSNVTQLTHLKGFAGVPVYSPDETHFMFQWRETINWTDNRKWLICIMNANNPGLRVITSGAANDQVPNWSKDGKSLLFFSDRSGKNQIYTMNTDGSDVRQILMSSHSDMVATWSPDESKIAFNSDRDGNNELYVMNSDGSDIKRLTSTKANERGPFWSPDGTRITFSSDGDGPAHVYVMNADGSDVLCLTCN